MLAREPVAEWRTLLNRGGARREMRLLTPRRQPSAYFRAIARHDVFLFGVLLGRLFDHRPQQFIVALDPVGHIDPLRAVPLVDARHARAFMIVARELQRLHEATEPELAQPRLIEVQVLDTPAHLLARERLLAVLRLGGANRLDRHHRVDHATVIKPVSYTHLRAHET